MFFFRTEKFFQRTSFLPRRWIQCFSLIFCVLFFNFILIKFSRFDHFPLHHQWSNGKLHRKSFDASFFDKIIKLFILNFSSRHLAPSKKKTKRCSMLQVQLETRFRFRQSLINIQMHQRYVLSFTPNKLSTYWWNMRQRKEGLFRPLIIFLFSPFSVHCACFWPMQDTNREEAMKRCKVSEILNEFCVIWVRQ